MVRPQAGIEGTMGIWRRMCSHLLGEPGKMHGPGGIQRGPQRMDQIPAAYSTGWVDAFRKRMGREQVVTTCTSLVRLLQRLNDGDKSA